MATERSQHQQWADKQVAALIEIGVNPLDAERNVNFVLDHLPFGENPATYIFSPAELWVDPSSEASVHDANAVWYASDDVPARFKMILSARAED